MKDRHSACFSSLYDSEKSVLCIIWSYKTSLHSSSSSTVDTRANLYLSNCERLQTIFWHLKTSKPRILFWKVLTLSSVQMDACTKTHFFTFLFVLLLSCALFHATDPNKRLIYDDESDPTVCLLSSFSPKEENDLKSCFVVAFVRSFVRSFSLTFSVSRSFGTIHRAPL